MLLRDAHVTRWPNQCSRPHCRALGRVDNAARSYFAPTAWRAPRPVNGHWRHATQRAPGHVDPTQARLVRRILVPELGHSLPRTIIYCRDRTADKIAHHTILFNKRHSRNGAKGASGRRGQLGPDSIRFLFRNAPIRVEPGH